MGWIRRRDRAQLERLQDELRAMHERIARHDETTESFRARLGDADETTSTVGVRLTAVADRLDALEARVESVSRELANQLVELGHDIDSLASQSPAALDPSEIAELRQTQTRLATEQARYQLAFREDLARLADHLRRP